MRRLDAHERCHAHRLARLQIDNGMKQRIIGLCDLRQPTAVTLELAERLLEQIGPIASLPVQCVGGKQFGGMARRLERFDPTKPALHRPCAAVAAGRSSRTAACRWVGRGRPLARVLRHGMSTLGISPCIPGQHQPQVAWQGHRPGRQFLPVLIELKNSPLVLVERSLSTRNSMASMVPIGLRMRRRTYIFLS